MSPSPVTVDLLAQIPGFELAGEPRLRAFAARLQLEEIVGRTFLEEGQEATDLFFLLQGEVEVVMTTPSGARVVVGVLGPPAVLGFAALFAQVRRVASVRARGRVRLLRMDGAVARALLEADDEDSAVLRRVMLIALSGQLARANQLFRRLSEASPAWERGLQGVVV